MSVWEYANPRKFMEVSAWVLPIVWICAILGVGAGLIWGFFFTPDDFRQGSTVKIIYIHVPAAFMGAGAWFMMVICSLIWLIRRHHVSALAAKAAAPVGAVFVAIGLFTGAVWGQPIWGTWWVWDPRLTSFFILFLFYLGYIALWSAIEDPDTAADLTSMLCLVGSVFAFLSRYAVYFWAQGMHQGASILRGEAVTQGDTEERMSNVFAVPLLVSIGGFLLLFIALVLLRTRTEVRARRLAALIARERTEAADA